MDELNITVETKEDVDFTENEEISEIRIKKVVNRRGKIRKHQTAGIRGRKITDGKVKLISGNERRQQRLGMIKRRRTLNAKSQGLKRRSALFAKLGRKKRRQMRVTDTRNG